MQPNTEMHYKYSHSTTKYSANTHNTTKYRKKHANTYSTTKDTSALQVARKWFRGTWSDKPGCDRLLFNVYSHLSLLSDLKDDFELSNWKMNTWVVKLMKMVCFQFACFLQLQPVELSQHTLPYNIQDVNSLFFKNVSKDYQG